MIAAERLASLSDALAFWTLDERPTGQSGPAEPDDESIWTEAGLLVRTVRGAKCRTVDAMFDEVSAAWQFPYYFGENWGAFDECLSDLEWQDLGRGIVFVIRQPDELLADEPVEQFEIFIGNLTSAHAAYREAIARGEWWDRPPVPFHVVLRLPAAQHASVIPRWQAAGARVELDVAPGVDDVS
jgi:hypothetical protein